MKQDTTPTDQQGGGLERETRGLTAGDVAISEQQVDGPRLMGGGDRRWAVSLAVFGFAIPVLLGLLVAAGLGAMSYWGITRVASS